MSNGYIRIVEKTWGEERWIRNDEHYCVKEMVLNPGFRCSLHYHPKKTETFYCIRGKVSVDLQEGVNVHEGARTLLAGDWLHLPAGTVHRFQAVGGGRAVLLECSTFHADDDVYRFELSGQVGNG